MRKKRKEKQSSSIRCSTWTMFSIMQKSSSDQDFPSTTKKGLLPMHSQWWFYLFCKIVCWFIAYHSLFSMEVSGRRQKCSTTTLLTNMYTEINQMLKVWILSAVTVNCVKKYKKFVYIFYYMLSVVLCR